MTLIIEVELLALIMMVKEGVALKCLFKDIKL